MGSEGAQATPWVATSLWPPVRKSPLVLVLAGVDSSEIADPALADTAVTEAVMIRLEPTCTPPCDALLWRLETAAGESLNAPAVLRRYWHRQPYAMTLRLVQYQPGSVVPEILDEATVGTRGPRAAFAASIARIAMRFVRDAALGRGRGRADTPSAVAPNGLPGWLDNARAKWHDRLTTEWWSLGSTTMPPQRVLAGALGDVVWYRPKAGHRYLADPFPWPGTSRILCEEMPLSDGVGRIVAVDAAGGTLSPPTVLLDDGSHHSYPCAFTERETVYCVPEATERGATRIYRLEGDGRLVPLCDPAPHLRLADPTLFRRNGRYWLACTDLDVGYHDNLCLMHSLEIDGPWTPHARWPVKIDVRGARCAGVPFTVNGSLFRPAQDCAETYGAAIAIHEIVTLTATDFREIPVTVLRPDRTGPFPHGLHTLVHDGDRFWVDGKRFILDTGMLRRKILAKTLSTFRRTEGH